jgi:homoserine/homoserine lactone efflux protein
MSLSVYLAFLAACIVVMIVPGPSVTLIVANSLRHSRRAGLLNVAGGQLGLAIVAAIALMGLASLIAAMGA